MAIPVPSSFSSNGPGKYYVDNQGLVPWRLRDNFKRSKKLEIGKNWRFWYKISHFEILSVHDLLQHLATAEEITQQED